MLVHILAERVVMCPKMKKAKIKIVISCGSIKLHSMKYKLEYPSGRVLNNLIIEFDTKGISNFDIRIFAIAPFAKGLASKVVCSAEVNIKESDMRQCSSHDHAALKKSNLYHIVLYKSSKRVQPMSKLFFKALNIKDRIQNQTMMDQNQSSSSSQTQKNAINNNYENHCHNNGLNGLDKSGNTKDINDNQFSKLNNNIFDFNNSNNISNNNAISNIGQYSKNKDSLEPIIARRLNSETPMNSKSSPVLEQQMNQSNNQTEKKDISNMSKREWMEYIAASNKKKIADKNLSKNSPPAKYIPPSDNKFNQLFKKSMSNMGSTTTTSSTTTNVDGDFMTSTSSDNKNQLSDSGTFTSGLDPLQQKLRQARFIQEDRHLLYLNEEDLQKADEGFEDSNIMNTGSEDNNNQTIKTKTINMNSVNNDIADNNNENQSNKEGKVLTLMNMPFIEPTEEELGKMPDYIIKRTTKDGYPEYYNTQTKKCTYMDPRKWNLAVRRNKKNGYTDDSLIEKIDAYHRLMNFKGPKNMKNFTTIVIDRANILESVMQLNDIESDKFRNTNLQVKFLGEEGIDLNGVKKELITLTSHSLFHPIYGLFKFLSPKSSEVTLNEFSLEFYPKEMIKLAARIIALAIIYNLTLSTTLSTLFIKALLGYPFDIEDLKIEDDALYESMLELKNGKAEDFGLNFFYTHQKMDGTEEYIALLGDIELSKQSVTDNNKDEYIRRFLEYRHCKYCKELYQLLRGYLREVLGSTHQLKDTFSPSEIVRMLCGEDNIDLEDMRKYTQYGGDLKHNPIIQANFWSLLCTCSKLQLCNMIYFFTSFYKTPPSGFKHLTMMNDVPMPFTVISNRNVDHLLSAKTCFNRVNIPWEADYEKFKEICIMSIESSFGFGTN